MRKLWLLAVCSLLACQSTEPVEPPPDDVGDRTVPFDAGVVAPAPDAAPTPADDAAVVPDGGAPDATITPADDAAVSPDGGVPDLGVVVPDGGARDGGAPDVGARDGGGAPDAQPGMDAQPMRPDSGAPAVLAPGWIGGPCMQDADCAYTGGRCLLDNAGWPGGTCTQSCTRTCPDRTMPLDAVTFCIDDGNGDANGLCVSRCDDTLSPTGCRAGYVCLPEKRMSQASVVRNVCVPETGVPGRPTPAFDIGAACVNDSACNRSRCLTDLPGGYCTQEQCNIVGCPGGSTCFNLGGQEAYYACLRTCAQSSECRTAETYACDTDSTCWPTPPAPATCNLVGGSSDCAPYAATATPDFVVVTKHLRRMTLCRGATAVRSDCVALGLSPVLDKEREGDRRTPEGTFYIPRLIPNSQYYKAFLISYPDAADAARGLAAGLITQSEHNAIVAAQNARREPPQNTALGGLVEIHGSGAGADWTWGCVATENTVIDVLWAALGVGDTVVINP
jgi:hypothetical protein